MGVSVRNSEYVRERGRRRESNEWRNRQSDEKGHRVTFTMSRGGR